MGKNWFRIIGRVFVLLLAVYGALSWLSQFHLESIGPAKGVAYWENADGVRLILRTDDAKSSSSDLTVACVKQPGWHIFETTPLIWLHRGRFTGAKWIDKDTVKLFLSHGAELDPESKDIISYPKVLYAMEYAKSFF